MDMITGRKTSYSQEPALNSGKTGACPSTTQEIVKNRPKRFQKGSTIYRGRKVVNAEEDAEIRGVTAKTFSFERTKGGAKWQSRRMGRKEEQAQ
jgi:hypothetical protein